MYLVHCGHWRSSLQLECQDEQLANRAANISRPRPERLPNWSRGMEKLEGCSLRTFLICFGQYPSW